MKIKPQQLVDTRPVRLSLIEASQSGNLRVRGEFARAGAATENKRVYPEKIWKKESVRLESTMKGRSMFGHPGHPGDGRTDLTKVSHIVTGLALEDGILIGEAEILPTEAGKNLMVLLQNNCRVGVSSRGFGSTKPSETGEDVVQEDYKLVTFDFVADPADQNAYPDVVAESAIFEGIDPAVYLKSTSDKPSTPEQKPSAPVISESQQAQFADDILGAVSAMKSEVTASVRSELLADPSVAGARTALEQVVGILRPFVLPSDAESVVRSKEAEIARLKLELDERALKIKDLETENTQLAEAAKTAGYYLYMERMLVNDPDAALIKKSVGDVKKFESAAALKEKLSSVREELTKRRETQAKVEETKAKELAASRELLKKVTAERDEEIVKLRQVVENLATANEALAIRVHTEKKLRHHPKASKIRGILEAANPSSKKTVNQILESYRPDQVRDEDEASELRARIRKHTRGRSSGVESTPLYEEGPGPEDRSEQHEGINYNDLNSNLDELQRLSGIK